MCKNAVVLSEAVIDELHRSELITPEQADQILEIVLSALNDAGDSECSSDHWADCVGRMVANRMIPNLKPQNSFGLIRACVRRSLNR